MKTHTIPLVTILVVLTTACAAFGQGQGGRQGFQNMSEAERERLREARERFDTMSPEEKEKFRAEMRERFGSRRQMLGREQQLEVIAAIQEQLAKLKAAVENIDPDARSRVRDLSDDERAKLREKMMASMRERQTALRAINEHLAKLGGPGRPGPDTRGPAGELKAIYDLAVKEKATETAKNIEKLMARYRRQSPGGMPGPRPRRERPPRPDRPGQADSGRRARPFALPTFDGKTVNLADYRGKTVVLEWLNFECPFVKHHYDKGSTMIDLARKYKDQDVVWLAINSTSHTTPAANAAFAAKKKLPYPILDDRSGKVGRAYGAKATPHMFVITPGGSIAYEGAIDNSPLGKTPAGQKLVNYVDKALAEVIAGKEVSTRNTKSYGCSVKYPK